jgi:hypothetical protein
VNIKPSIYEVLKAKLGREPTHKEMVRDVQRIFAEARAGRAALLAKERDHERDPHQDHPDRR